MIRLLVLFLLAVLPAYAVGPNCTPSAPNAVACQAPASNLQQTDVLLGQQATGPGRLNQTVKVMPSQIIGLDHAAAPVTAVGTTTTIADWLSRAPTGNIWLSSHHVAPGSDLYISVSNDGLSWRHLMNMSLYSATGGYTVHDPTMTFLNGTFYVAYLNKVINPTSSFGIVSSTDLIHWTFVQNVPVPIPGAGANQVVWSPFWFTDTDGSLHVFLGASPDCKPTGMNCDGTAPGMNLYEMHPLDVTNLAGSWSTPVLITGTNIPTSSGTTPGIFNPTVIKRGSTYNLFYNNGQNNYYYEWASSTSLTSGYSTVRTGNWAGWQPTGSPPQGLSMVHVEPNHWRAYFDYGPIGVTSYSDCLSEDWTVCTWTALAALTFTDGVKENQGTFQLFPAAASIPLITLSATFGMVEDRQNPMCMQGVLCIGTTFDGGTGWASNRLAMYFNDGTVRSAYQHASSALYLGTISNHTVNFMANNATRLSIDPATAAVNVNFLLGLPVTTVGALPTCNGTRSGMMTTVSDATAPTYNGTLTGGGAVKVPAFCNGTTWTAH